MIGYSLPNPDNSSISASNRVENTIIFASTCKKYFYPSHSTPHLLVANFRNPGAYLLNDRQISTNDKSFYFLNPGDKLEINFRHNLPTDTFLILFNNNFITEVINICQSTTNGLLERPFEINNTEFRTPSVPFFFNSAILRCFNSIKTNGMDDLFNPDCLLSDLVVEFFKLRHDTIPEIEKINAKRKSTREELYRRITLAKLYMEENALLPLTIDQIAIVACLNKFHFLKVFKDMHGITPHQFLINKKLEKSLVLLKSGNFSIGEICQLVGFESLGTFTNLFKRRYGQSPSKFY